MIGAFLVLSAFVVAGIGLILFPHQIQKYVVGSWGAWLKFGPSRSNIEGPLYVWKLRLVGLFSLGVGLYFMFSLFGN